MKCINIGIPQGSILGPLLFIIFVNCLPDAVNCKTIMYADDTTLLCTADNADDLTLQLESNLGEVANWFNVNKLTLNLDKTKLMVFGTRHVLNRFKDVSLSHNNNAIERVEEFKYLGVKFDCSMSWSSHIDKISSDVRKRIGVIRRVKYFLPMTTLNMLCNSLVMPHFDYCSPVWSNCSLDSQIHLQRLQNQLARTILSADIRTPINDMLDHLNWIKLDQRWSNHMLILVFKCLRNFAPDYLSSKFHFVHDVHNYSTRNHSSNALALPKSNSNSGMRTFQVRAAHIWNSLPQSVRKDSATTSLSQFKYNNLVHVS